MKLSILMLAACLISGVPARAQDVFDPSVWAQSEKLGKDIPRRQGPRRGRTGPPDGAYRLAAALRSQRYFEIRAK